MIVRALLATIAMIAAAQSLGAQTVDSAAQVARGKTLFDGRGLCFSCHGKGGEGVLGPTTKLVGRVLTHTKALAPEIAALIRSGVDSSHSTSGQLMPPRGGSRISDDDVAAVAAYVMVLRQNHPD
ncbi:MAG TPA: c-type cytochrome [Gemmatimonadales bacterium]|jgi:mono/diheme cytochrome c family protein